MSRCTGSAGRGGHTLPPECGQGARGFPQPRRLLLSARGVRSACRGLCSPRSALPSQPAALPPARCAPGRRAGLVRRRQPGPRLGGQLFGGETVRAALCCPLQSAPSTRAEAESPRTPKLSYGSELKWAGKRRVAQGSCGFRVCETYVGLVPVPLGSSSLGTVFQLPRLWAVCLWYPPTSCSDPGPVWGDRYFSLVMATMGWHGPGSESDWQGPERASV